MPSLTIAYPRTLWIPAQGRNDEWVANDERVTNDDWVAEDLFNSEQLRQSVRSAQGQTRTRLIMATDMRRVAAMARKTMGQGLPVMSSRTLKIRACAPA